MTNISEITNQMNQLATTWEEFKSVNDRRLAEIEKKGNADPLIDQQLNRLHATLDQYKSRLTSVENTLARPSTFGSTLSLESDEHKNAFNDYLRKGIDSNLNSIQKKYMSIGSDTDGGYLVTRQMSKDLVTAIHEISPMRQLCGIDSISTDSLEIIEDYDHAGAGWTAETTPVTETSTPTLGRKRIQVHELYAQPKASQKLIDDASINVESWLVGKLVDTFSSLENQSFINGDGQGKPRGILSYKAGTTWGEIEQVASDGKGITSDCLYALLYSMTDQYAARATFMMHRSTLQHIRTIKDKNGQYIWSPGLAGAPNNLLGLPVVTSVDMPIMGEGKNTLAVALADFKTAYRIVDRIGVRVLRDPFTEKPFVKFYATKRVGGDVVNYQAIKLLRVNN
jgi:HK97 family phage major capsid protein